MTEIAERLRQAAGVPPGVPEARQLPALLIEAADELDRLNAIIDAADAALTKAEADE